MSERELHPKHGPHDPRQRLPIRRAGSLRRTTTIDSLRPDGVLGSVVVDGRARDLFTGHDGSYSVLDEASLRAHIDFVDARRVLEISVTPALDLAQLVDTSVMSGFRDRVDAAFPDGRTSHTVRYQLLDDLPTALLVSGYAIGAAGMHRSATGPRQQYPDLCAGFMVGGTILVEEDTTGHIPVVTGPEAVPLISQARADDPQSWHEVGELAPHAMRRLRLLDVWRSGSTISVENYFRDSHMSGNGLETVVHEYTVRAELDPRLGVFVSSDATPHSLPWLECPLAAASASRVAGTPIDGLRRHVREAFVGPSTCTHLNDTLRAMEDIAALAMHLPE